MKMEAKAMSELLKKAIAGGATQDSLLGWIWEVYGDCSEPVSVCYSSKYEVNARLRGVASRQLVIFSRCRKCENCLKARARKWRARARAEFVTSNRVWFVTLTARPDWHFICEIIAKNRLSLKGQIWERLDDAAKFAARCHELTRECQLFMKRIRKNSGASLRFIRVFEAHKSGLPHVHMLIYEKTSRRVSKRQLQAAWTIGFSNAKLADKAAAAYVTKYLSKDMRARVRASNRLGQQPTT